MIISSVRLKVQNRDRARPRTSQFCNPEHETKVLDPTGFDSRLKTF